MIEVLFIVVGNECGYGKFPLIRIGYNAAVNGAFKLDFYFCQNFIKIFTFLGIC
jgi:hypothetical protein